MTLDQFKDFERWGSYCVGGACVLWDRYGAITPPKHAPSSGELFPPVVTLAEALQNLNSALDKKQALEFATKIIDLNDLGKFGRAWKVVEKALKNIDA
jgi:hypothetical protein